MISRVFRRAFSTVFDESRKTALLLMEEKKIDKAIPHLQIALEKAKEAKDFYRASEMIDLLSYANFSLSDYAALGKTLSQKLELMLERKPMESALLVAFQNLIRCYVDANDFDRALFYASQYADIVKGMKLSKAFQNRMRLAELTILIILGEADVNEASQEIKTLLESTQAIEVQIPCYTNLALLELMKTEEEADIETALKHFKSALLLSETENETNRRILKRFTVADETNIDDTPEALYGRNLEALNEFLNTGIKKQPFYLVGPKFDFLAANIIQLLISLKKEQEAKILLLSTIDSASRLGKLDFLHRLWNLAQVVSGSNSTPEITEKNLEKAARFALVNNSVIRHQLVTDYAAFLDYQGRLYEASQAYELRGADLGSLRLKEWVSLPEMKFSKTAV